MKNPLRTPRSCRILLAAACLLLAAISTVLLALAEDPYVFYAEVSFENMDGVVGAVPASGNFAAEQITSISMTSPYNQRTYVERSVPPPDLTVVLDVVIQNDKYTTGGRIELPLDYTPTLATHPGFDYGTDGTDGPADTMPPFFFFVEPTEANAIVDRYDLASKPGTLVIHLADMHSSPEFTESGLYPIPLTFEFNQAWNEKIPRSAKLWNIAPTAYVGEELAATATPIALGTTAYPYVYSYGSYINPASEIYVEGEISSGRYIQDYSAGTDPEQHSLDSRYRNVSWLEIPAGSTLDASTAAYYTAPKIPNFATYDGILYDRYERVFTGGSLQDFRTIYVTPPLDMPSETSFAIRFGGDIKRFNEEAFTFEVAKPYLKTDRPMWELYTGIYTPVNGEDYCGLSDGSTSSLVGQYASYPYYNDFRTIKNTGAGPITGVSFDFHQPVSGSGKINFAWAEVFVSRDSVASPYPLWSHYKVKYEIVNAKTGATRFEEDAMGVWEPTATEADDSNPLTLPALGASEYINRLSIIPMDVDGLTEGAWPGQNGIGVKYGIQAWDGRLWPDGTAIPNWSKTKTEWRLYYDDNPDKPAAYPAGGGTPTSVQNCVVDNYYCDGPKASCFLKRPNADQSFPGDIVDYTIEPQALVNDWVNPRIIVRVRNFITLLDGDGNPMDTVGGSAAFTGTTWEGAYDVIATFTGEDATYHYYSFQVQDCSLSSSPMTIPVQFKVEDNALAGEWTPEVFLTSADAGSFAQNGIHGDQMNLLTAAEEALMGLNPGDNYYWQRSYTLAYVNVVDLPQIDGMIAMKSAATSSKYVYTQLVPAKPGEQVTMRLSLVNNGNTTHNSIRLYDILPYAGDLLNTTGSLSYVSITSSATPYERWWASASVDLPTYGEHGGDNPDLQSFSTAGWSSTELGADTKAVYFNFLHNLWLQPGDTLDIDITFKVPEDATNQVAYSQFRYSAGRLNNPHIMNLNSSKAGFFTYQLNLLYDANLAAAPAATDSQATGIPMDATAFMGFAPAVGTNKDGLTVDTAVPTLTGYTFTGWNTESDGSGDPYAPGEVVSFTGAGTVTLHAQWEVNKNNITYAYTGPVPDGAPAAPAGETGVAYGASKQVAPVPSLAGYTFSGWATSDAAVTSNAFTMPNQAVAFTGSWTANTNTAYTVQHYYVSVSGTAATSPFETDVLAGTTGTIATASPKTGLIRYIHDAAYPGTVASGTIAGNGSLVLKLYYRESVHAITYAYTGTVPQGAPAAPAGETSVGYGESKTVAAVPSLTGYSFSGWKTTDVTVSGNSFTMPNQAVAFTGSWLLKTDVSYTVQYLEKTTNKVLAPDKTVTGQTFFTTVTEAAISIKGYTAAAPTSQSLKLSGYGLVMTFYYTETPADPTPAPTTQQVRVSFFDSLDNNSLIYSELVNIGGSVTPPTPPVYDGYEFTGWQGVYENVQKNENVFTRYIEAQTLSIKITKSWIAPAGTALPSVTVRLLRDGMQYRTLKLNGSEGWVGYFTDLPQTAANGRAYAYSVTENSIPGFTLVSVTGSPNETEGFTLTNRAGGANGQLKVTFVDWDGTELKHEYVAYGGSATPPQSPQRDRYSFAGWMGKWENVTRDEFVFARYGRAAYGAGRVGGADGDGTAIFDAAIPLAGGSVSNFGDCVE